MATTQRERAGGVTTLHRSGAGPGPVQIVSLRLALLARVAFRVHLTQPQLSKHLVDLR
jgi:hypothetical protein